MSALDNPRDCGRRLWAVPNLAVVHKFKWPKNLFVSLTDIYRKSYSANKKCRVVATRKKILLFLLLFC